MRRIILIIFLLLTLSLTPAYSYWIWTPKSGKFVNPKNLPKSTPKEQFEYAKSFYNIKKYDDAIREDRKSTRLNSSHSGESRMPSSA